MWKGNRAGGGGIRVKSRQRGSFVFSGSVSTTVTITTVNNAIVRCSTKSSSTSSSANGSSMSVRSAFNSNTEISFNRASSLVTVTVYWEVIEFENATIYSGVVSLTDNATLTIPSIDSQNALLFYTQDQNDTLTTAGGVLAVLELVNDTTLACRCAIPNGHTFSYFIVTE